MDSPIDDWGVRVVLFIGGTDSSLIYHLENAKAHGVTKEEAAAIITHTARMVHNCMCIK